MQAPFTTPSSQKILFVSWACPWSKETMLWWVKTCNHRRCRLIDKNYDRLSEANKLELDLLQELTFEMLNVCFDLKENV
jgi:hypothetical protein